MQGGHLAVRRYAFGLFKAFAMINDQASINTMSLFLGAPIQDPGQGSS